MPHIVIEYSGNLIEKSINSDHLRDLHSLLIEVGPFKLNDIKSRAIKHDTYCVSDGADENAFIHLQLAILPGRSVETKRIVTERLLQYLKEKFVRSSAVLKCSYSVEIRELDLDTYAKSIGLTACSD